MVTALFAFLAYCALAFGLCAAVVVFGGFCPAYSQTLSPSPPSLSIPDVSTLPTDQVALWGLALGLVVPLVVATINSEKWRPEVKTAVAFLVCVGISVGSLYVRHQLDLSNGFRLAVFVVVSSAIIYKQLWHGSGVTNALEKGVDLAALFKGKT